MLKVIKLSERYRLHSCFQEIEIYIAYLFPAVDYLSCTQKKRLKIFDDTSG